MAVRNPFAFRPGPVTFWTTVVYLAVIIPLLYVHETVPPAPSDTTLERGLNLTEAWSDLQTITKTYHPYNSHENDHVRDFIIARSKSVLERNGLDYAVDTSGGVTWRYGFVHLHPRDAGEYTSLRIAVLNLPQKGTLARRRSAQANRPVLPSSTTAFPT